ncbi:MAG: response regulator, partial [Flavobacteriales bacterium]|nr:response regulator [Flavobacteriales bacterium]
MKQVRIFIVEDEPLIAEDLAASLEELGYQVCGRAESALDAMAGIATEKPDLILM